MNTILLPTDFSEVASNAARYAGKLAAQLQAKKIVLYNAFQAPVITEPTMPVVQLIDMDSLKTVTEEGLANFKASMLADVPAGVEIETISEFAVLSGNIEEVCERTNADIIVMGISGGSKLEEVLIGSTAISVVNHARIPVIVIPPNATYSRIETVALACDYKKIDDAAAIETIRKILGETGAALHVLHVDEHKKMNAEATEESNRLEALLSAFKPTFHVIEHEDFVEGINLFADENNVDLLITIPKKHGLFEGLFKRSHTKKLAFHSHVPLLCIHE